MDISRYTDVEYDFVFENLKEEEGCRYTVYPDTLGIMTIGIGRNIEANPIEHLLGRKHIKTITEQEVHILFDDSLKTALESIQIDLKVHPHDVQYVIISLTFNMSWNRFSKFKATLDALARHDYKFAAQRLKLSKWYGQVGNRGPKLVEMVRHAG